MMPKPNQTITEYLHECAALGGEFLPRATEAEIEALKARGYCVHSHTTPADHVWPEAVTEFMWVLNSCEFQDDEPSMAEADAWALALAHSRRNQA